MSSFWPGLALKPLQSISLLSQPHHCSTQVCELQTTDYSLGFSTRSHTWHKADTQRMFAVRTQIREWKKGLGSSNLISKSVVLLGLHYTQGHMGLILVHFLWLKISCSFGGWTCHMDRMFLFTIAIIQQLSQICFRLVVWLCPASAAIISTP